MAKARMAMDAIRALGGGTKNLLFGNMKAKDIAGRLSFDALFGGMAALQTPGDIGDKLIGRWLYLRWRWSNWSCSWWRSQTYGWPSMA